MHQPTQHHIDHAAWRKALAARQKLADQANQVAMLGSTTWTTDDFNAPLEPAITADDVPAPPASGQAHGRATHRASHRSTSSSGDDAPGEPAPPLGGELSAETFCRLIRPPGADGYIEVRYRTPHGWRQEYFTDTGCAATLLQDVGAKHDAYVGTAPRRTRSGRSEDVEQAWLISADCDTEAALNALADFEPPPTAIIASGSLTPTGRAKVHAHWVLSEPVDRTTLVASKRALARALGSDPAIVDAARIMRVPGTFNHKASPPAPVTVMEWVAERRYRAEDVIGPIRLTPERPPRTLNADDPLLEIPPVAYAEELAGVEADERGMACCPFHDDSTPSLKLYETPAAGWYCFGCQRGGDIYNFAALLVEGQPSLAGPGFIRLRESLTDFFTEAWS